MKTLLSTLGVLCASALLLSCPAKKPDPGGGGGGPTINRCEFDVAGSSLFSQVGSGASAKIIASDAEFIGGEFAQAQVGDALIQNDRIRVVIQRPTRNIAPMPFGGFIIDADLQRNGAPGQDTLGRYSLFYAFGRTVQATDIEVVNDGSNGGAAIVAVTGHDALNDYTNINHVIGSFLPGQQLVVDANTPLPIRGTTYYVLSPGENRVRIVSNFCNDGNEIVQMPLGYLAEEGGVSSFFNPSGCANRPGTEPAGGAACLVDTSSWFAYQSKGVAYAMRGYRLDDPSKPEDADALISMAGVTGSLIEGQNEAGLLTWTDPSAHNRPGAFSIRAGGSRAYLHDFVVARDTAELHSTFLALDGKSHARLNITVNGADFAQAPVEVINLATGRLVAIPYTDDSGAAKIDLEPGSYSVTAGVPGRVSNTATVTVPSSGDVSATVTIPTARTLTVTVKDPSGTAQPAKVTVFCASGSCPNANSWARFTETDPMPSNVASVTLVPPAGTVNIPLPPDQYQVLVTRGPEWSAYPNTWRPVDPTTAQPVDLTAGNQTVNATIAQVVDSSGWMSGDLHVHAVNSPDSSAPNDLRVMSFMAEGVDVLVSTDHDFVTDYAPIIASLNGQNYMASIVGDEVSTMDFGHYNAYPLVRDNNSVIGGAFDWAGGEGPTYRQSQMFAKLHDLQGNPVVQYNHPRGNLGGFSYLKVDTLTGASHADPALFRMEPDPSATPNDTRLFSWDFDAMEIQNGLSAPDALLNDWFTFLSLGRVKTATAVSDTHKIYAVAAGYSRTYVKMSTDAPAQLNPAEFASGIKAHHAFGTNGPFVRFSAQKLDSTSTPTGPIAGVGDTISVAAGDQLQLTVDVQGPEWMTFDQIDIFTHAAGREAVNGASNDTPPTPVATRTLDLASLPVEAVPGLPTGYRRVHVTQQFTVTANADTWFAAIVRSSSAARPMFPLAWDGTGCNSSGVCNANSGRPFAFTNPILVDADGSGKYDHFPLQGAGSPSPMPKPSKAPPQQAIPAPQFERLMQSINYEKHYW